MRGFGKNGDTEFERDGYDYMQRIKLLSRPKPTRNCIVNRRKSYCRTKKKLHTGKFIFKIYSVEYIYIYIYIYIT